MRRRRARARCGPNRARARGRDGGSFSLTRRAACSQALVWALYLPRYPTAVCEDGPLARLSVDGTAFLYHPDVLALPPSGAGLSAAQPGAPLWWAECGSVSVPKLCALASAYPSTAFTIAKWAQSDLRGYAGSLRQQLPAHAARRFEVISFPGDAPERFISEDGVVSVGFADLLDRVMVLELEE